MPVKYVLLVNKQGQTRLSRYFVHVPPSERLGLEGEIVRRCLARGPTQCMFMDFRDDRVIYRRYASLYLIMVVDQYENELGVLELIHLYVESLDLYFSSVCELDIMFNLDRAHMILDEILLNGDIVETSKKLILEPIYLIDTVTKKGTA